MKSAPNQRPDATDLIGADWDRNSTAPADKVLIICSAPRTGSYELCRFLAAAGLGVPHEYFHSYFAKELMTRWDLTGDPLSPAGLESYIAALRRRRVVGGVLSVKLQYWQFNAFLRNRHGAALFDGAHVVHLFRPDIRGQLLSFREARKTGRWDYSMRQTSDPKSTADESSLDGILRQIEFLVEEDAGFRRLFALLGIDPLFVTMQELIDDPSRIVHAIALRCGASIDEDALAKMIMAGSRYPRHAVASSPVIEQLFEQIRQSPFTP